MPHNCRQELRPLAKLDMRDVDLGKVERFRRDVPQRVSIKDPQLAIRKADR